MASYDKNRRLTFFPILFNLFILLICTLFLSLFYGSVTSTWNLSAIALVVLPLLSSLWALDSSSLVLVGASKRKNIAIVFNLIAFCFPFIFLGEYVSFQVDDILPNLIVGLLVATWFSLFPLYNLLVLHRLGVEAWITTKTVRKPMVAGAFGIAIALMYLVAVRVVETASSFTGRGEYWSAKGDQRRAVENFTKAIKLNPKYPNLYSKRGNAYDALGDKKRSIEDYTKAIELNPKKSTAYLDRCFAFSKLGDKKAAMEDCNKAVLLEPKSPESYIARGLEYSRQGDYKKAIEDINKAIELNPKHLTTYFWRGAVYDKLGDRKHAIEDMRVAARMGNVNAPQWLKDRNISW